MTITTLQIALESWSRIYLKGGDGHRSYCYLWQKPWHMKNIMGPLCSHRDFSGYNMSLLIALLSGKESTCQCRRRRFDPWVGKILWRRKWQLAPVFLPGKFHGQGRAGKPGRLQSMGLQRVEHDLGTKQQQSLQHFDVARVSMMTSDLWRRNLWFRG